MIEIHFDGFDWDSANLHKNLVKHGVSKQDIEHALLTRLALVEDASHSIEERRLTALGRDLGARMLLVVFTLRQKGAFLLARPISARHLHAKELKTYGIR